MEKTTLKQVYREIKLLRKDLDSLKEMLIPESEPLPDEIEAVRAARKDFRAKRTVEWERIKKKI